MIHERIFDAWSFIIIIGILHGLIIAGIFFFKKGETPANKLIVLLILLLIWHHLQSLSIYLGFYKQFPHFYGADLGSLFLIGPLFYLYISFLTKSKTDWKKTDFLHFLPFLITLFIHPVIFQKTATKVKTIQSWLTATRYDNPELKKAFFLDDTIFFMESIHMLIYLILALILLRRYRERLKNYTSDLHRLNFQWLRNLTLAFILVVLVSFILQKSLYIYLKYYYYSLDYIYILPMTVVIYMIGIYAIRKPVILTGIGIDNMKYQRSSLSKEQADIYLERLNEYIIEHKPYLNQEIKLPDLAVKLDMQTNHLSQLINDRLGLKFFDFINQLRVEEAKKRLQNPIYKNDKLFKIAMDSGFNNKTSFNNYFKKLTGTTPSEFRKKNEKNM